MISNAQAYFVLSYERLSSSLQWVAWFYSSAALKSQFNAITWSYVTTVLEALFLKHHRYYSNLLTGTEVKGSFEVETEDYEVRIKWKMHKVECLYAVYSNAA